MTAGRSALQEVIGNVELAVKKGERRNCLQDAPGLCEKGLRSKLGSEDLPALDARASILMTRLEHEAEKENDMCLQEVA